MTKKDELLSKLKYQLDRAEARVRTLENEQRARETALIRAGFIPVEMLLDVRFIEANNIQTAQVTISDREVLAKLRLVQHEANMEAFRGILPQAIPHGGIGIFAASTPNTASSAAGGHQ